MIEAMRELALLTLQLSLRTNGTMAEIRNQYRKDLRPWLVEENEKIERVYLLERDQGRSDAVRMTAVELDCQRAARLPFVKPSGSQSAAVGPVIKRSNKKGKSPPFGPSKKIVQTTIKSFSSLGDAQEPWADYFKEITGILEAKSLIWNATEISVGKDCEDPNVLLAACRVITDAKSVFVAIADNEGRWPGDRPEYLQYLEKISAETKYVTGDAPGKAGSRCALCGSEGETIFPNALKGAGINFGNMDRAGAFPSIKVRNAWKAYGLCLDCADLLYIFKNHVLSDLVGRVAGQKTLLIPSLLGNQDGRKRFLKDFRKYVQNLDSSNVQSRERDLIEFFAGRGDAHVVLHILWAKFGQLIEDVQGVINDVLPSRLQDLLQLNRSVNENQHPSFPDFTPEEARLDLSLSILGRLFKREGESLRKRLQGPGRAGHLQRMIAASLYHGQPMRDLESLFWDEILEAAKSYMDVAIRQGNSWGLCHEGISTKDGKSKYFWTLAGWMRHLARFLYYLDQAEVLSMNDKSSADAYKPTMDALRCYFTPETGINSREKAYAFLLGVLFGKLVQVQAARGVNVTSNALTWLKRLQLTGSDLPELYVKIREKLLSYGTEGSAAVRELIQEIGHLGVILGEPIKLERVCTCYFLLLGQSLSTKILPKTESEKDGSDTEEQANERS